MARNKSTYLNELSTTDLRKLLAARERIDVLEKEKASLQKKLDGIEAELEQLVSGVDKRRVGRPRAAKKVTKKAAKKTAKKVGRPRKAAVKTAGKTVKKTAARKVGRPRKVAEKVAKKVTKKAVKKAPVRGGSKGKVSLVDVVVGVLQQAGRPMPFKEIFEVIHAGKLYKTKSKSFDNLLRKTLSSSDRFTRAGRGVYTLA